LPYALDSMEPSSSQTEIISNHSKTHKLKKYVGLSLHLRDRSEVSIVIKYFIFVFNVLFWLIGVGLLAVGLWAVAEKNAALNLSTLGESFINPVLLLLISGSVIFVVGFFGCIGALRENVFVISVYIVCVGIVFIFLVIGAIILFAFRDWIKTELLVSPLKRTIVQYRDDADLQNLVDWIQGEWSYKDWEQNVYFNCSSPGVEACGVPFSCCRPNTDPNIVEVNYECGYNVLQDSIGNDPSKVIYTTGCINQGDAWFQLYMIPVAGVIVAVALIQIVGICCAWNLYSDINRQKAKWRRQQRVEFSASYD